jgi:PQQ-like domain
MRTAKAVHRQRDRVAVMVVITALVLVSSPLPAFAAAGSTLWVARYNGPRHGFDVAGALAVGPDGTRVYVTGGSGSGKHEDFATDAYDALTGVVVWTSRYDGPGHEADRASAVALSADGATVYVTGRSTGSGTGTDYATVAYDAAGGSQIWARRYDGAATGLDLDQPTSLAVSPDGAQVYVSGRSPGPLAYFDYATIAYDALTGTKIWVRRYNGPGNADDRANALAVSPDGARVYVSGDSTGGDLTGIAYTTVAYDAVNGATLWVRRYDGPGDGFDIAHALGVSPDGTRVYVTGESGGSASTTDYVTVAYDGVTGAKAWARRYDGPGKGDDRADALGVSPDGTRLYVTGISDGSTTEADFGYATIAYDAATGARVWVRRSIGSGGSSPQADALAVSPDGARVYTTGLSFTGSATFYDYRTVAYDAATGTKAWVRRYNDRANGFDIPGDIAVSPDGARVYVTGSSDRPQPPSESDYLTVAYGTG